MNDVGRADARESELSVHAPAILHDRRSRLGTNGVDQLQRMRAIPAN
jgi:hypothetical protein